MRSSDPAAVGRPGKGGNSHAGRERTQVDISHLRDDALGATGDRNYNEIGEFDRLTSKKCNALTVW
jgi:hypothetical protein